MISQIRKYLKDLDNVIEVIDDLPVIDDKTFRFQSFIYNEIEREYERIYNILEIKIKRGKKK